MPKRYLDYAMVGKVYRADNKDLKIYSRNGNYMPGSHDVIVVSVNKRNNTCKVKTITSLERKYKGEYLFIAKKLPDVRNGKILVVPIKDIHTDHLSGVNHNTKEIKINKLYFTNTKAVFPRRYKHLVFKK